MKTAKEFNIRIQARKCNMEVKEKMVIWHHGMKPKDNYKWNKKASICLRLNHGVATMKELKELVEDGIERTQEECDQGSACIKIDRKSTRLNSSHSSPSRMPSSA